MKRMLLIITIRTLGIKNEYTVTPAVKEAQKSNIKFSVSKLKKTTTTTKTPTQAIWLRKAY